MFHPLCLSEQKIAWAMFEKKLFLYLMNIIKYLSNPSENIEKSLRARDLVSTFSIYVAVSLLSIVMSVIQNFLVQSPTVEMRENPLVTIADEGVLVLVFIVVLMAIAEEIAFRLPLKRTKWRIFTALSIAFFFLYSKLLTDCLVLSLDDMMLRVGLTIGSMTLLCPLLLSSSMLKRISSLNYKYYFYSLAVLFGFGHLGNLDFQSIDDWSVTALFWIAIYALLKTLSGVVLGYARMRHGFRVACLMHVLHNLPPILLAIFLLVE